MRATWPGRLSLPVLTRGNAVAGIAVGSYLLPQAMAYGELSGIGAGAGLAMAAIPLLLYPLLGRSTYLSLGPESTTALMAAVTVAPIVAQHPGSELAVMSAVTVLTGLLLLAAWAVRAGVIADLLSRPVLLGYMSGIAVLMVASQLPLLLGGDLRTSTVLSLLGSLGGIAPDWQAIALAAGTAAAMWLAGRLVPRAPGALIALAMATVAGMLLGAPTIPDVQLSVHLGGLPPAEALDEILLGAMALAVVSASDTVLTARAFTRSGEHVSANREIGTLGAVNAVNGLLGAYPASSSSSRSAIARAAGADSRYYSWLVLAFAAASCLLLGSLVTAIPKAALAGIVLYAAFRLVDAAGLARLRMLRARELGIAVATGLSVALLGVLPGIAIAVALSVSELLARLMRPHEGILGFVPGLAGMHDVDDHPQAVQEPGLVVFRYDAPLFFANARDFYDKTIAAVETRPDAQWLILNVEANVEVDSTGLDSLEQVHAELTARGMHVALARAKNDLLLPMRSYGTLEVIGEENVYPTLPTAVDAYRTWAEAQSQSRQ